MQKRHINNRQHAIPFRQQFLEQLAEEYPFFCSLILLSKLIYFSLKSIDRKLEADRREQVDKKDKLTRLLRRTDKSDKGVACLLREAEVCMQRPISLYVGYLTSGFEYFSRGFARAVDQTRHKVDQHTIRRALFDTSIRFLKSSFYPTKKFTKP